MKYLITIFFILSSVITYGQSSPKITVSPTGNMMINSGSVTTTNVVLESTSTNFSSLISDGTISATVHYNRFTNQVGTGTSGGNDLISAPVTGQTFGSFATANTNLADSGNIRAFAPFINTGSPPGAYVNYIVGTNDAVTLDAGTGYRAATDTDDGSPLKFTGTVNTGAVLVSIVDGTGSAWNLIGNPFPSYIDFATFFSNNAAQLDSGEFQAIYGYDDDASNGSVWTIWNNLNTTDKMTPGQGFFVRAKEGAGTIPDDTQVTFASSLRTTGNSDDFIIGRSSYSDVALATITLSLSSNFYKTDIYFVDGATHELDPGYDAGAFQGNASGIFTLLVEDNAGVEMAIQALPYNDFNNVVVPLGIKANAGEQISIGFDVDSTIPANINVYLEDNVPNTFSLLNTNDYTITPSVTLDGAGRFFLHFSSTTLSVNDIELNGIHIYTSSSPKALFVNGRLNTKATADLYDIFGRHVICKMLDINSINNEIDISAVSSGIYIVRVNNGELTKSQKVIIN